VNPVIPDLTMNPAKTNIGVLCAPPDAGLAVTPAQAGAVWQCYLIRAA
jgi:hypothetical protein